MADLGLVKLMQQGGEIWNDWRENQPNDEVDLSEADLSSADLNGADLHNANLRFADLSFADLSRVDLSRANLFKADLFGANLRRSHLSNVNLSCANLSSADLSDAGLLRANLSDAVLSNANLTRVYLWNAYLSGADLNCTILREADLRDVDLSYANLHEADLRACILSRANLRYANLSSADLRGAILGAASLNHVNLSDADMCGVKISGTLFVSVDLRQVKNLTEVIHQGPSHVELHTLQLPADGSALQFLRGVGVSDEWISDYQARIIHPIRYYSCFISYSGKDEALAKRLSADLQAQGVRCWFAPHDMKIGARIRSTLDQAIRQQEKLLLLLSEYSIASGWVEDEVEIALERERKEYREILFPINLDNTITRADIPAWAEKLRRQVHIGDFTRWADPQAYNQAFERLVRDLKAKKNA